MVELLFSKENAVPELVDAEKQLAGAVFVHSGQADKVWYPDRYQTFQRNTLSAWLDSGASLVHGTTVETIEQQLHLKFPALPGAQRVLRIYDYKLDRGMYMPEAGMPPQNRDRYFRHGGTWLPYHPAMWVILKEPLVTIQPDTALETIRTWHASLGRSILVRESSLPNDLRSDDVWRRLGFSCGHRYPNLYLIGFNPRGAATTIHKQQMVGYKEVMRGEFDCSPLFYIQNCFRTDDWPWESNDDAEHELRDLISAGRDSGYSSYLNSEDKPDGYGRVARDTMRRITASRALCRRLLGSRQPWWRDRSCFKSALDRLAVHLHGVEEKYRNSDDDGAKEVLQLCRWIRRECKIAKVKIPAKPRKPKLQVLGAAKRKRKKKKASVASGK